MHAGPIVLLLSKFCACVSLYCCGASEQRHKQDLRRIYRREYEFSNSPLSECIAFNQTALRHLLPECIAPRTTRGCHTVEPFLMHHVKVCKSGDLKRLLESSVYTRGGVLNNRCLGREVRPGR